jgi:gamma-butyrobetaine dioxygenase
MTRQLAVARVLLSHGVRRYPEAVTQLEHALQCAALARRDRAADELVLAALLHDIGHLTPGASQFVAAAEEPNRHHGQWGALLVRPFVPARVAWLIEHHVVAKRYLCTVDRGYADRLSPASARSLVAQGGPLSLSERLRLEAQPWFADAVRLRYWDDEANDPAATPPPLTDYLPLLERHFGPQSRRQLASS